MVLLLAYGSTQLKDKSSIPANPEGDYFDFAKNFFAFYADEDPASAIINEESRISSLMVTDGSSALSVFNVETVFCIALYSSFPSFEQSAFGVTLSLWLAGNTFVLFFWLAGEGYW